MNKIELTIDGNKYDAHFGFGFIEKCLESEEVPNNDITQLSAIKRMYYSIVYGCEIKGEKFMTRAEFYGLLDDLNSEEIEFILGTYSIGFLRSWKKKMKLDPKAEKELDKALIDQEKKLKPQKAVTAAK